MNELADHREWLFLSCREWLGWSFSLLKNLWVWSDLLKNVSSVTCSPGTSGMHYTMYTFYVCIHKWHALWALRGKCEITQCVWVHMDVGWLLCHLLLPPCAWECDLWSQPMNEGWEIFIKGLLVAFSCMDYQVHPAGSADPSSLKSIDLFVSICVEQSIPGKSWRFCEWWLMHSGVFCLVLAF